MGKLNNYFFFSRQWGKGGGRPISGILPFVPDLLGHWLLVEAADGSVGGLLRLPPPARRESARAFNHRLVAGNLPLG